MDIRNPFGKKIQLSKYEENGECLMQALQMHQKGDLAFSVYGYQVEAAKAVKKMFTEDELTQREGDASKPSLIVAPTGSGKTGIIVMLPYFLRAKKVLVVTPSKVIGVQIADAFGRNLLKNQEACFFYQTKVCTDFHQLAQVLESPVTIIEKSEDVNTLLGNIVIVNAQKFSGNSKRSLLGHSGKELIEDTRKCFDQFDVVIVDEAHHFPAPTWLQIVHEATRYVPGMVKKVVFLTATPYRRGPKGTEQFILGEGEEAKSRIAYTITKEMVEGKTVRPTRFLEVFDPPTHQEVANRIKGLLKQHECHAKNLFVPQAMIYVLRIKEAIDWAEYLNGDMNDPNYAIPIFGKDGTANLLKFKEGNYRVAVTCHIGLEGFDNSKVTLCVILRNVKSRVYFSQFIGRCMRPHRTKDGKTDASEAVVLSYSKYGQKRMWEEKDLLANEDPEDEGEDETEFVEGLIRSHETRKRKSGCSETIENLGRGRGGKRGRGRGRGRGGGNQGQENNTPTMEKERRRRPGQDEPNSFFKDIGID